MREESIESGNERLIDAVKGGDVSLVEQLLNAGADVSARDKDDWSALDWAAGRGEAAVIRVLLDAGADVYAMGKEQRKPYDIALAAGHLEAVGLLTEAEDKIDPDAASQRTWHPYCRAYLLSDLSQFPGWPADMAQDDSTHGAEDVAFLHDDLTVTRSMWRGEDVIFDAVTDEWRQFCCTRLGFAVPRDVDLVPEPHRR